MAEDEKDIFKGWREMMEAGVLIDKISSLEKKVDDLEMKYDQGHGQRIEKLENDVACKTGSEIGKLQVELSELKKGEKVLVSDVHEYKKMTKKLERIQNSIILKTDEISELKASSASHTDKIHEIRNRILNIKPNNELFIKCLRMQQQIDDLKDKLNDGEKLGVTLSTDNISRKELDSILSIEEEYEKGLKEGKWLEYPPKEPPLLTPCDECEYYNDYQKKCIATFYCEFKKQLEKEPTPSKRICERCIYEYTKHDWCAAGHEQYSLSNQIVDCLDFKKYAEKEPPEVICPSPSPVMECSNCDNFLASDGTYTCECGKEFKIKGIRVEKAELEEQLSNMDWILNEMYATHYNTELYQRILTEYSEFRKKYGEDKE